MVSYTDPRIDMWTEGMRRGRLECLRVRKENISAAYSSTTLASAWGRVVEFLNFASVHWNSLQIMKEARAKGGRLYDADVNLPADEIFRENFIKGLHEQVAQ
jgi:hypothetical protein